MNSETHILTPANGSQVGGIQQPHLPAALPQTNEKPLRAVWVAVAVLLFMIFASVAYTPGRGYAMGRNLASQCEMLAIACAIYLFFQNGTKIVGGIICFFTSIITVITSQFSLAALNTRTVPLIKLIFSSKPVARLLFRQIIEVSLTIALCLIIFYCSTKSKKSKLFLAAWLTGALYAASRIYDMIKLSIYSELPLYIISGLLLGSLAMALGRTLAVFVVQALCTLKQSKLKTNGLAKIWFVLCAIFAASVPNMLLNKQPIGIGNLVLVLAVVVGYGFLVFSYRFGFVLMLMASGITTFGYFTFELSHSQPNFENILITIFSGVHMLITWLFIRKTWQAGEYASVRNATPTYATPTYATPTYAAPAYAPARPVAVTTAAFAHAQAPPATLAIKTQAVYTFIATTNFLLDFSDPPSKILAEQILTFTCKQQQENSPVFAQKYKEVDTLQLPNHFGSGSAATPEGLNNAFKEWIIRQGLPLPNFAEAINRTLFVQAGEMQNPALGQTGTWCMYIYFLVE